MQWRGRRASSNVEDRRGMGGLPMMEEALNAATAIGDDNIQKQSQGYVVPDSFTHGTSAQRARWFRRGYETGDINQGDTFALRDAEL